MTNCYAGARLACCGVMFSFLVNPAVVIFLLLQAV